MALHAFAVGAMLYQGAVRVSDAEYLVEVALLEAALISAPAGFGEARPEEEVAITVASEHAMAEAPSAAPPILPTPPVPKPVPEPKPEPKPEPEPEPEPKPAARHTSPEVAAADQRATATEEARTNELPTSTAAARSNTGNAQGAESGAQPSSNMTAPVFSAAYLHNPPPTYPRVSRRLGEQGEVQLRVKVNPQGRASHIEIARSSGFARLDQAAAAAVSQWQFKPAQQNGQAIEAWVMIPISFNLES